MCEKAVAHFPCRLRHQFADTGQEDFRFPVGVRPGIEERRHQSVRVEVAPEGKFRAVVPAVPDRVHRHHKFAHSGGWRTPWHGEALFDMGFDLRTEAQNHSALRQPMDVVSLNGHRHRVSCKRNRDVRAQLDLLGGRCGHGEKRERIVAGLRRPRPVVAVEFGLACTFSRTGPVDSDSTIYEHVVTLTRTPANDETVRNRLSRLLNQAGLGPLPTMRLAICCEGEDRLVPLLNHAVLASWFQGPSRPTRF